MRARSPASRHQLRVEHHRHGLARRGSSSPGAPGRPGSRPPAAAAAGSAPTAVSTSTTPRRAYSIWCTSWECQPVISAVALVEVAARQRPPTAAQVDDRRASMLADSAKSLSESAETVTTVLDGTTLTGGMNIDDLILVSIDDHVVEPPDMFLQPRARQVQGRGADRRHRRQGRRPVDVPGPAAGRQRAQRRGVVAGGGVGPRPRRLRRDATRRLRRARARPRHEPQRHPRLDVLPDLHRLLRAAPEQAPRGRHAGHGVGLQRLAHRRVGGQLPGPVHPDRGAADVESRGDVRRDPPGGRQGLPRGDDAGTAAPRGPAELPRRGLLGPGVPHAVRGERRDVPAHRHRVRRDQHGAERPDRQPDHPGHPDLGDVRPGSAVGPGDAQLPGPEVRLLRGRHRLDPVLSGPQRPALHQPEVAAPRLRRQAAQRRVPRAFAGLLRHRQDVAEAAPRDRHRHHRLGVRLPALGLLLARRARAGAGRTERRRRRRRRHQQDHLGELLPVLRLGPVRAAHPSEQATVGALRAKATDVDVSIRPRKEWARLYEQKRLTKA